LEWRAIRRRRRLDHHGRLSFDAARAHPQPATARSAAWGLVPPLRDTPVFV